MTIISFTGTHGTGKTTLASTLAKKLNIPFFASRASEAFQRHGYVLSGTQNGLTLRERMDVQHTIFSLWAEDIERAAKHGAGIFDRCPLDFAAYTLGDVGVLTKDEDSRLVEEYVKQCMTTASSLPNILLVAPHGGTMQVRDATKPPVQNRAYARLIHVTIVGLLHDAAIPYHAVPPGDNDFRVDLVGRFLNAQFNRDAVEMASDESQERPESYLH